MLTKNKKALAIFDDFWVDDELPKFAKKNAEITAALNKGGLDADLLNASNAVLASAEGEPMRFKRTSNRDRRAQEIGERAAGSVLNLPDQVQSLFVMAEDQLTRQHQKILKDAPKPPAPKVMPVGRFFASIKNSAEELVVVKSRSAGYEKAVKDAVRNGQVAFAEKLNAGLMAIRAETQLVSIGLPRYLEEKAVVDLAKKSERAIRLDWMMNFTRVIPAEVIATKDRADAVGAFDNYVVMHYDPTGEGSETTEAEKAETKAAIAQKKKDPILFGVINGRRRLYFVGDWVDEFCDLTLDKVAEILGKDAVRELGTTFDPKKEP